MSTTSEGWLQNSKTGPIDPNEKLFVFGYSCKIFRDDEKSAYIDQGKHLIPWMGDKTLMIDRYDVRGYLHDLSQYEPSSNEFEDLISEEEKLCDEERYRSLRSDMSEEQLYQEEELKRLRAAIAGDGAYHEIAFTYENAEDEKYVEPEPQKVEEPEDEPYQMPEGLDAPKGMELPFTMKIHTIIEKTAMFVSEQGGQMEIIIKMKQHANPQFAFMHLDNPLYPYYKHLVKQLKSGAYKPVLKEKVSKSEDEDDDDHYLHPSLMAGKAEPVPKFTVPNINFRRSSDDSYSVLVRNLQQARAAEEAANSPSQNSPESQTQDTDSSSDQVNSSTIASVVSQAVPPPPDLQPIIDKMAEYVAKNGEDFETIVKAKNDHRFDFLHSWHGYHSYYIFKRNNLRKEFFGNGTGPIKQPPVVRESGPVLYSNAGPVSSETRVKAAKPPPPPPARRAKMERDSLYSQNSQSPLPSLRNEETSDSFGCDSPAHSENSVETRKPLKVSKGPISFSLKGKDVDQPSEKSKLTPLMLDDSEEENEEDGTNEPKKKKKSEERYSPEELVRANASETKPAKPSSEVLEAKQAEERVRDKLLGTVRERLAQQRKEKQLIAEAQAREELRVKEKLRQLETARKEKRLQAERRRKADLFLRMLRDKGGAPPAPLITNNNKLHKHRKSTDSEQSGEEEPISVFGEKLSSDPETFGPQEKPEEEEPKKKRRRSRERPIKPPKSSRHDRSRSRSPPSRRKKEKQLPAAYALSSRSRSRSRSPRRYRPSFNSWHRRR